MTIKYKYLDRLYNNKFLCEIFNKPSKDIIDLAVSKYDEPHRFYHNCVHLENLLDAITRLNLPSHEDVEIMDTIALFHDVIYDPRSNQNEVNSEKFFAEFLKSDIGDEVVKDVRDAILSTDYTNTKDDYNYFFEFFKRIDLIYPLFYSSFKELMESEAKIRKEYQWVPYPEYKNKRLDFLTKLAEINNKNAKNSPVFFEYLEWVNYPSLKGEASD